MAIADIRATILAEASNGMSGRKKPADFITIDDPASGICVRRWFIGGDALSELVLPS